MTPDDRRPHAEGRRPHCPYCGTTREVREVEPAHSPLGPDYICEGCFSPKDDGPCFDDLSKPLVSDTALKNTERHAEWLERRLDEDSKATDEWPDWKKEQAGLKNTERDDGTR